MVKLLHDVMCKMPHFVEFSPGINPVRNARAPLELRAHPTKARSIIIGIFDLQQKNENGQKSKYLSIAIAVQLKRNSWKFEWCARKKKRTANKTTMSHITSKSVRRTKKNSRHWNIANMISPQKCRKITERKRYIVFFVLASK